MTPLIGEIVKQLGVQEQQAKGGVILLYGLAKNELSESDFSAVAAAVGTLETLIGPLSKKTKMAGMWNRFLAAIGFEKREGGELGGLLGEMASMTGISDMVDLASVASEVVNVETIKSVIEPAGSVKDLLTPESSSKLASLAPKFKKLGLDKSMPKKFATVFLGFARQKGGDAVDKKLQKVWQ